MHYNNRIIYNMYNPAFSGSILLYCIEGYCETEKKEFDYPLTYLILPLIFHEETRTKINSNYISLYNLFVENENLLIDVAERIKEFRSITHDAFLFLVMHKYIILSHSGTLNLTNKKIENKINSANIVKLYRSAVRLGRLIYSTDSTSSIFEIMGVRP